MNWAYSNKVLLPEAVVEATETVDESQTFSNLIDLCLLGDFLDDVRFRNEALQLLNNFAIEANTMLSSYHYCQIWDHTPSNSLLRAWAVDAFISLAESTVLKNIGRSYPAEFLVDVAIEAIGRNKNEYADDDGLNARFTHYLEPVADH